MSHAPGGTVAVVIDGWRRGGGLGELPGWAVDGFAVLTHLGDSWLLAALAVLTYLAYDRRAGGFVGGTTLVGLAAVYTLKAWFALPRPPADLHVVAATGYGFPSGHAVGATVTWGALVVALDDVSTARQRTAVAAVVIAAVALSRVALGVHYPADVLAGVAVGLAVLVVAARWGRDVPLGLFGSAVAIALAGIASPASRWPLIALLGAALGAITAWQLVEPADRPWGRHGIVAAGGVVVAVAVILAVADPVGALAYAASALATVAVLAGPALSDRWPGRGYADDRARG